MISIVVVEAMGQCSVDKRRIARRGFQRCAPNCAGTDSGVITCEVQQNRPDLLPGCQNCNTQTVENCDLCVFQGFCGDSVLTEIQQ